MGNWFETSQCAKPTAVPLHKYGSDVIFQYANGLGVSQMVKQKHVCILGFQSGYFYDFYDFPIKVYALL